MLIEFEPVAGPLVHIFEDAGLEWAVRLEKGVFLTHLNGREHFPGLEDFPKFKGYRSSYGVCDEIQQIKDHYPELESQDRKFVVLMTEIRKDEEEGPGWRWHKWGPYIGTHQPRFEYLYDEEGIERVFTFRIMEQV